MIELLSGTRLADRAGQALAVPIQQALGVRLLDPEDPPSGARLTVGELAGNGAGGLHAAALSAVLEVAGYLALLPYLDITEHALTHSVATNLIAAATAGQQVDVRGTVDRRTRRLAFVSVTASVDEVTIARAQLTKSIVEMR